MQKTITTILILTLFIIQLWCETGGAGEDSMSQFDLKHKELIAKANASVAKARLLAEKESKERKERSEQRSLQIGWGGRSEKIRTYNYPQDRITDHRIKKSWHGIDKILDGELDPIIAAFKEEEKKQE